MTTFANGCLEVNGIWFTVSSPVTMLSL